MSLVERQQGVLKEGFLKKLGEKVKSWKNRYFVLRHDRQHLQFEYYRGRKGELLGSFSVKDLSAFHLVEPPSSPLPDQPVLEITTPARVYHMTATEGELAEWAWAVEKALEYLQGAAAENGVPGSPSARRRSGFLMKKGGKRHNWKKRWFVLNDMVLRYYKQNKKDCLGTIDLAECLGVCRLRTVKGKEERHICSVLTPGRVYQLMAETPAVLCEWLGAFERAGCQLTMGSTQPDGQSTFYQFLDESDSNDDMDSQSMRSDSGSLSGSTRSLASAGTEGGAGSPGPVRRARSSTRPKVPSPLMPRAHTAVTSALDLADRAPGPEPSGAREAREGRSMTMQATTANGGGAQLQPARPVPSSPRCIEGPATGPAGAGSGARRTFQELHLLYKPPPEALPPSYCTEAVC